MLKNIKNTLFGRKKSKKIHDLAFVSGKDSDRYPSSAGASCYGRSDFSHYHVTYFLKGVLKSDVYTCKNTENFNIKKFQTDVVSKVGCILSDVVVMNWKFMPTKEYTEVYADNS